MALDITSSRSHPVSNHQTTRPYSSSWPQLDQFESPHHNQTIRSSAKIADIRKSARRARAPKCNTQQIIDQEYNNGHKQRRRQQQRLSYSTMMMSPLISQSNSNTETISRSNNIMVQHCTNHLRCESNYRRFFSDNHQRSLLNFTAALLVTLLASNITTLATDGNSSSAGATNPPAPLLQVAKAEALTSNNKLTGNANDNIMNQNVILIKYANVTKTTKDDGDEQQQLRLNVYQLYNEPLSVSVIESKFSHAIQLFDVSHNQLSTLSKDLFCPLSNDVRQLNISHNLLENFDCLGLISQAGQLCLSELRVLDMSYNLIKHLPATGVATLHNLEVLDLSHNLIESLDELSLSALFKLTRLDLSYNRIRQLPMRIFHKSTSMQVLRLQANHLQNTINQAFLTGLISLEELNLSYNNISHVSELAFLDKSNLTHVDLSHNQLTGLRQESLRVTIPGGYNQQSNSRLYSSQPVLKPRLHHNGQYAGLAPVSTPVAHQKFMPFVTEFLLSSNPFICDCQLDWMRKFQSTTSAKNSKTVLSNPSGSKFNQFHRQPVDNNDSYQNDQPASVIQQQAASLEQTIASNSNSENNILQLQSSSNPSAQATLASIQYGRIADLEYIKCSPLFRRNAQLRATHRQHQLRSQTPSDGTHTHNLAVQVHHANNHLHHNHHQSHGASQLMKSSSDGSAITAGGSYAINLLTADSSNFLCRYKSHCFALCHCCEFDACDCEMICPSGCNCYYDSSWQTNIIDCSTNNHTVVPDRIPMDVSGLYLDGNNIESLKPSNLIARKSLKTLYLNSSNLQYIANRTFNGLIELQTLYLNDNMLRSLYGYEFEPLAQLRALYLQSNRLDHINNQTFIYLRSLESLDLSNNRLTSMNLDLFMSIGHHNIRLRQLTIAHNWWSCQCNMINSFRQILKQKFLINGGVNIADRNQLRCYYNSTTVGPLILDSGIASSTGQQQPVFGSFLSASGYQLQQTDSNNRQQQQQQQQLTEINQCSDMIEDQRPFDSDINPPIIQAPTISELPTNQNAMLPSNDSPEDMAASINQQQQQQNQAQNQFGSPYQQPADSPYYPNSPPFDPLNGPLQPGLQMGEHFGSRNPLNTPNTGGPSIPLTSFIFVTVLFICIFVVAISVFIFIRQQQRYQHHHKKSSAASTISVSSSASSTAISAQHHHNHHSGTAKFGQRAGDQHQHQALLFDQHQQNQTMHHHNHLIMAHGMPATAVGQQQVIHSQHHHHSASSQSNIYAALVSPTNGSSTIVATNTAASLQQKQNNNLYSNSSSTASHHSSTSSSQHINGQHSFPTTTGVHAATTNRWQHQQPLYGAPIHHQQIYGQVPTESPYAINTPIASYKTGTSLYNGPLTPTLSGNNCHAEGAANPTDWIRLPKVKQFVSKLVNKSLALGGYRTSNSRDELASVASDKIYDAFLSYDKRDEPFVLQHLSAELEYGLQYRVADRYRDLPAPSSAYMAEAISSVIGCSHRTIVVLSENFLSSDWCRFELQAALRESALDKSHKIIAVVLDPRCLMDMDPELRSLLLSGTGQTTAMQQQQHQPIYSQQQGQLVQLADAAGNSTPSSIEQQQQQLVTTLTDHSSGQVCTQTTQANGGCKISFVNYNERRFWPKLKQLMPLARPTAQQQTLTLTTKN